MTPSKIHKGQIRDDLLSTNITHKCAGIKEVFRELWIQDAVTVDSDPLDEKKDGMLQPESTPKSVKISDEGSILNIALINRNRSKEIQFIFTLDLGPILNQKNKRGMLRDIMFKTYFQFSLAISIQ